MLKIDPQELTAQLAAGDLPLGVILLTGTCGSGKSAWLNRFLPKAHRVNLLPSQTDQKKISQWRLCHLMQLDALFVTQEKHLIWRCPKCGQQVAQSHINHLLGQVQRDFKAAVLIGFPYTGYRQELIGKGFWRLMGDDGVSSLPETEWIEADILVDRLNMMNADVSRVQESLRQALIGGLGTVVVWGDGRRLLYGPRYHCPTCLISQAGLRPGDFLAWSQGRSMAKKEWPDFFWKEISLENWVNMSAAQWLESSSKWQAEPWQGMWQLRLDLLKEFKLHHLPLSRKIGELSSSERNLVLMSRCHFWQVSGQDVIFDHPHEGLDEEDQKRVKRLIEGVKSKACRVWVENHSLKMSGAGDVMVEFSKPRAPTLDLILSDGIEELLPWTLTGLMERIAAHRRLGQGAIILLRGGRGVGKTRLLNELAQESQLLKRQGFIEVVGLDADPWCQAENSDNLAEVTGVWNWLSECLLDDPTLRHLRLTPHHFMRHHPLGACLECQGHRLSPPCQTCQGTGMNERILHLKYAGMSLGTLLAMSLKEVQELLIKLSPKWLAFRLTRLQHTSLGQIPLKRLVCELSRGENWGLILLLGLTRNQTPTLFLLDEPLQNLDIPFVSEVFVAMRREISRQSVFVMVSSADHFREFVPLPKK